MHLIKIDKNNITSHNFKIGTELVEVDKPWALRKTFSLPDSKWENELKKSITTSSKSHSPGYEENTEKNKQTGQTSMEHFEVVKSQLTHRALQSRQQLNAMAELLGR